MKRDFEKEILRMFALCPDCKFRWSEIRDHLWIVMKVPSQYNKNTFNVKLYRNLKKLVKGGWLKRIGKGHQNTIYELDKKGSERIMRDYGADPSLNYTLVGTYRHGDSYDNFKEKAMKRLEQLLEKDMRQSYKEAKKFDKSTGNERA